MTLVLRMPVHSAGLLVARDVADLLARAAPVVVVLEDLHWSDPSSLDLLDDLAHDPPPGVLLVATSRRPLELTAEVGTITLTALGATDLHDLLAELLGGEPPEALVAEVGRRSGGNPLFATEVAIALQAAGLVQVVDGGVLVAADSDLAAAVDLVPDTLEGLIGARIDALDAARDQHDGVPAIADAVQEGLGKKGVKPAIVEGENRGDWILLDYFDFVVHIFTPMTRQFYDLERLWADAERVEIEQFHISGTQFKVRFRKRFESG